MLKISGACAPDINSCMKTVRHYLIPFTYDHDPEDCDFIKVNTTDMKEVRRLAQCVFGSRGQLTIAYEDVEIEE
tara:strand:+ start:1318 stop:1539 length:222 start_codon:yes stop_codon:yes gene_type:complete